MTGTGGGGDEHYSRQIRELCALLLTLVSPMPAQAPGRMSPAAAASMLLGASVALMLCGSVTFAIGLLLMPWVAGLALLFGFAGAVSNLSSGFFFGKPAPRGRICSPIDSDLLVGS